MSAVAELIFYIAMPTENSKEVWTEIIFFEITLLFSSFLHQAAEIDHYLHVISILA